MAIPGESPLAGYCYVLKKRKSADSDLSFYYPSCFKKAITIRYG